MKIHELHSWDLTEAEAVALQKELAGRVETRTPLTSCELIAGADISYNRFSDVLYAAVVVLRADTLKLVETQSAVATVKFPYVPGLLSFREAPPLLEAFAKVKAEPDVVMLDGQGLAHPRRMGLACHLGLWLDRPTIGCAKTRLIGRSGELGEEAGSVAPLTDRKETVGMVVRTKKRTQPLYVSVGHKIDLASAVRVVLDSCRGYRVPEPTRQAHLFVNALRAEAAC
jgi:deoxyribonuclease V